MAIDLTNVEIRAVKSPISTDKRVVSTDSGVKKQSKANSTSARFEFCEVTVRVKSADWDQYFTALQGSVGQISAWNAPGVQPFIRATENPSVRLIGYSPPQKVYPFVWEHNIILQYAP